MRAARLAPREVSQIFTAYLPTRDSGHTSDDRIRAVAVNRAATYVLVWLECGVDELARRMTLLERRERAKMRDPQALREALVTLGTLAALPIALRIAPADAALLIASYAGARF